jgi:hypothetical protein
VNNQGNRDQEGNLGRAGRDPGKPAGTSVRDGDTGNENSQQGNSDTNRTRNRNHRNDDDEDSGLGNRTTNR